LSNSDTLGIWTVYARPRDYPAQFVARLFYLDQPSDQVLLADTLAEIREQLAAWGLMCLPRQPGDEPHIVEVWL